MQNLDIYTIAQLSLTFWHESYDDNMDQILWSGLKDLMYNKYISSIEKENKDLVENCYILKDKYEYELRKYIIFYRKSEFILACMSLKEYFVKHQTKLCEKIPYVRNEQDCIQYILSLALNINDTDYHNNSFNEIVYPHSYFIDIISLARLYVYLCSNLEKLEFLQISKYSLSDIAFNDLDSNDFNLYYDEFNAQGEQNRPEDYEFKDIGIISKLERDDKSLSKIINESDIIVKKYLGFTHRALSLISTLFYQIVFNNNEDFINYIEDDDAYMPLIEVDVDLFTETLKKQISEDELHNIINNFEIKINPLLSPENQINKLEVSCFYRYGSHLYFGIVDLAQSFEMFKKFILTGYHLDIYTYNNDLERALNSSQKKLSTFLCYTLTDMLKFNGYSLHTEVFKYKNKRYSVPTVEEKQININGINIADKYGDYDVIFLDEYKNQIVCVEFKCFKPGMHYNDLIHADRNKIKKQILGEDEDAKKIRTRENVVRDNIEFFIRYLNGDVNKSYTVKSIIVLSRPNLYSYSSKFRNNEWNISFHTINSFSRLIENHDI